MTTNLERIRKMTADELAELIDTSCDCCAYVKCKLDVDCKQGIKQWLEQEVDK